MQYLLDANVIIDAERDYYRLSRVPEFWPWLEHMSSKGTIKIPREIMSEVLRGSRKNDPLIAWLRENERHKRLTLEESATKELILRAQNAYATDLSDIELEQIGLDPILIAYGLAGRHSRIIVSSENSRPSKKRANRHVPDVCASLGVRCCSVLEMLTDLEFSTTWRPAEDEGSQGDY